MFLGIWNTCFVNRNLLNSSVVLKNMLKSDEDISLPIRHEFFFFLHLLVLDCSGYGSLPDNFEIHE